jgi:hypothetical protein
MSYRIVPISPGIAAFVRTHLRAPQYGHPATVELASGYGPCRQCLRVFREGEEDRVLFTFNATPTEEGLPQPGPVFIHKEPCAPFDQDGVPEDLRHLPLFLEGFGKASWLVRRMPVRPGRVEDAIAELLADPEVERVHIRNAEAGCFIARVERMP